MLIADLWHLVFAVALEDLANYCQTQRVQLALRFYAALNQACPELYNQNFVKKKSKCHIEGFSQRVRLSNGALESKQ